ncbi:hypothetical protein MMC19_006044 [Ptychographa xylographoides]|nr:hypothetical protein [Ptychographa xylographoides]
MHLSTLTSLASVGAFAFGASAYTAASTSQTDALAAQGAYNLAVYEKQNYNPNAKCNLGTGYVRQEWTALSSQQKVAYSNAVLCLMSKPAKSSKTAVPGARSRYDDFVAVHINQTLTIHGTANFLSWHRYFVWTFEQALRNECGYQGYQPYWNWGKSAYDPINSPYFDGSANSMGGNGVYEKHNATVALPTALNNIPPGVGGGCVKTGPFKNMVVNLGPVAPTLAEPEVVPQNGNGLNYNPRCVKRDISEWVSSQWNTDADSYSLIANNTDISDFQTIMQGVFDQGFYGVHTGGHFTFGGDPGGDIFASPGDPMFWLHHAQIDRTWWIWQNQNIAARQNAIGGTITLNNNPPSRAGTLQDYVDLGVNAPPVQISTLMSTLAGEFCYVYA